MSRRLEKVIIKKLQQKDMKRKLIIQDNKTAVVGLVVYKQKTLLLKRNRPPLNWCPPCGRVDVNESLENALIREVKEETGLSIDIIKYASDWEGMHIGKKIRSFTFICKAISDEIILSEEHCDFSWVNIKDLNKWTNKTDFSLEKWPKWIEEAFK